MNVAAEGFAPLPTTAKYLGVLMSRMSKLAATYLFCIGQSAFGQPDSGPIGVSTCGYDREGLLALDEASFDQDLEHGWRSVARQEGCLAVAADLIRDYREANSLSSRMLFWHEGQLRAYSGDVERAIPLLAKSQREDDDGLPWNLYVDATIAFLKQDKEALLQARDALANLPEPEAQLHIDAFGNGIPPPPWPPNLSVVDRFIECFGRTYPEAYARCEP
jgi:hypothetical protein